VQRMQRGVADRALGFHQQLVRPQLREAGHLVLRQELPPAAQQRTSASAKAASDAAPATGCT